MRVLPAAGLEPEIETAYVAPVVSEAQPKAESTKVVEPEVIKEEPIPIPETEVKEEEKSVPLPSSEPVPLPKVDEPVIEVMRKIQKRQTMIRRRLFSNVQSLIPSQNLSLSLSLSRNLNLSLNQNQSQRQLSRMHLLQIVTIAVSVEEIAEATGMDLKMLKEYIPADLDGDGEVTLEELKYNRKLPKEWFLPNRLPARAGIKILQSRCKM